MRVGLACCRERVILLCLLFAVMFAVSLDFIIDSFALSCGAHRLAAIVASLVTSDKPINPLTGHHSARLSCSSHCLVLLPRLPGLVSSRQSQMYQSSSRNSPQPHTGVLLLAEGRSSRSPTCLS